MIITSIDYGMPTEAEPEIINFTTSGSTASAAAIPHGTTVELHTTENCYWGVGASAPTASSTSHFLVKDIPQRYTMHGNMFIGARGEINTGFLRITVLVMGGGA